MISLSPAALAGLALLSLSACAGSTASYPSLAPRPIEQGASAPAAAETPTATAPAPLDPAVTARAAALVAQATRGEATVATAARAACPAIVRGLRAAEGSDAWVAAQQGLSVVEAARRETASAHDDIEAMVLDQARLAEGQARPADLSPLLAAADDIATRDTAQAARLTAIRAGSCAG